MKCPICQKELEIKNKKVGENEAGEAIFNEYGICRDCKKQWNLDKHRAKKAEQPKQEEKEVVPASAPVVTDAPAKPKKKKRPVNPDAASTEVQPKPKKKRRPAPVADEPKASEASIEKALEAFTEVSAAEAPAEKPMKKKRPVVDDATKVLDKLPSLEELAPVIETKAADVAEIKLEVPEEPANTPAPEEVPAKPKKKKRRPVDDDAMSIDKALEALTDEPVLVLPAEEPVERPKKKKRPVNPDAVPSTDEQPRPKKKRRPAPENLATDKAPAAKAPVLEEEVAERPRKKKRPVNPDAVSERPARVKQPVQRAAAPADDFDFNFDAEEAPKKPRKRKPIDNRQEEPTFSNIPPKHVREAREKEMRQNYQLMVDEDDEDDKGFPTVLIVILVILLLAAAAFAGYWFFLR